MYTRNFLTNAVLALPANEQTQLFQLMSNNAALLEKVMPGLPGLPHMYNRDELTKSVMTLSDDEQAQLFQLISNHAALLEKVMPGLPLVALVLDGSSEINHILLDKYLHWNSNKAI